MTKKNRKTELKTSFVQFYLTPGEKQILERLADIDRLSLSQAIRTLILNDARKKGLVQLEKHQDINI